MAAISRSVVGMSYVSSRVIVRVAIVLPFLVVVNVNVEAVCLAWVNVVPKSELLGEVAALALGAVADVGHVLTFRCLGSSRRFDGLKRV